MSNQEFENYIALIGKLLQLNREQRGQIAGELQDHLQMRVADLESEGVEKQEAIRRALEEFGDAAAMAKNFQSVINHKKRRRMMRFITFSIAGSFVAAVLLMALWPSESRFGAPSRSIAQDGKAAEKVTTTTEPPIQFSPGTELAIKTEHAFRQITDLHYDGDPWSEVMEDLAMTTGANFFLSSSAADDALTYDEPITINLAGVPLSKGLSLLLAAKNATYTIDDGVVVIISLDDAEDVQWFRMKMYDCRELVAVLPKSRRKTRPPVITVGGARGGGAFSVAQGLPAPAQQDKADDSQAKKGDPDVSALLDKKLNNIMSLMKSNLEKDLADPTSEQTLVNLVLSQVQPDSWQSSGQGLGSIDAVNGILVVSQKEEVHQEIDKLLADLEANVLRRTRKQPVPKSSGVSSVEKAAVKPSAATKANKVEDPFK